MSSESLQSIYQQYKHDTKVVASWLATTAQAFGYSGQLGGKTAPKPSSRLKGKDRKLAKAQQFPSLEPSEPSKPKYILAIKDFVPLAEHIAHASNASKIELPSSFSVSLERVIWVRSSFSEKLTDAGRNVDQYSDARHSFFVSVLEKVRKTLQPLMTLDAFNVSTLKDAVTKIGKRKDKKGLASLFEVLDVYEPSAAFEAAPDVVLPPPSETEYTVEVEENSLFEAIFAMTTLMGDLSRLRIEIAELWTRYEAGEMDIAAVAVATNTAIELARNFEDEIAPLVQKNGGSTVFHHQYFSTICQVSGINPEAKQRLTDDYNFAAYDMADTLLINTLVNIIAFVRANPEGEIPSYNGLYGWYDEDSILTGGSGRQKYARMKSALLEMLSDIPLMSNHRGPVEDQLMYGLRTTLRTEKREQNEPPKVPIWFSFAAQVYLDTLNVVKIGKGWTDLQRVMRNVKQSVHALPTSCSERGKVLRDMDNWDKGIDPIAIIRSTLGVPYKDFTFHRRHFLHCGLWIHHLRTLFHQQGVTYAAVPGTVLCTTQLYHALCQEKSLNSTWKDLETLRKMQGNSTFFIGEPPNSFEGYFNNYCICLGMSITNWAANKRDKKVKVSKDNKPLMKLLGLTSTPFANRIGFISNRRPISVEVVEDWIQNGSKTQENTKNKETQTPTAKDNKKMRQPLIYRLAAAVASEIPELEFDYFAIHNLCREVLLRLQAEHEKVTGPDFTKSYMARGEANLAFVVGFFFSTVAQQKSIGTVEVSPTRLLEIVAETFNQWLSEGRGSTITGTGSEESE